MADGRRTWASHQPATRAAFADLARRHRLRFRWRDDVSFEVVATYPVQPGLSLAFTLALEKATIHCWGEGWNIDGIWIGEPDAGLPGGLAQALDALIDGTGRIVTRTVRGASSPFHVALQMNVEGRWRTVLHRMWPPWPPLWRRDVIVNDDVVRGA